MQSSVDLRWQAFHDLASYAHCGVTAFSCFLPHPRYWSLHYLAVESAIPECMRQATGQPVFPLLFLLSSDMHYGDRLDPGEEWLSPTNTVNKTSDCSETKRSKPATITYR
jgi:hypothetical protein